MVASYGDSSHWRTGQEDALVSADVTRDDGGEEVIARWTGIPVTSAQRCRDPKFVAEQIEFAQLVVSQRPQFHRLARAITPFPARGLKPRAAGGSFLFLGSHGVADRSRPSSRSSCLIVTCLIRFTCRNSWKSIPFKLMVLPAGYVVMKRVH